VRVFLLFSFLTTLR